MRGLPVLNKHAYFETISDIPIPVALIWSIDKSPASGGNAMSIDFEAEPYGKCSFYIGDTSPHPILHPYVQFKVKSTSTKLKLMKSVAGRYWQILKPGSICNTDFVFTYH